MEYDFFLFFSLYSLEYPIIRKLPYDVAYEVLSSEYNKWLIYDKEHSQNIGTYESIQNFIKSDQRLTDEL
jgi:hypothetical protein